MRMPMTAFTMSNHCSSPCGTTGPRGSSDMVSGRMTWSCGSARVVRMAVRAERSLVNASQAPLSYDSWATCDSSNTLAS